MDLKQIEKLMMAMHRSRIKRVAIKREGFEIEVERECAIPTYVESTLASPVVQTPPPKEEVSIPSPPSKEEDGYEITSPMVGTFYASPSPEDPPYVKVGDQVEEETVVCIIEAMKVMNEVKAGVKGTLVEQLVKNGEPVEFGTQIFKVRTE